MCIIAIEGEKREKQYFDKFGNTKIKVVTLPTLTGDSSEPEEIIKRLREYKEKEDIQEDDMCWLVFDVDNRSEERLKVVCDEAEKENFRVAISNPCFEFWLFLHKFDAKGLDQSIYQVSPEQRPKLMKQILHDSKYDYHSLDHWDFPKDVEGAIERAKNKERGRRKSFPLFPGTDVYKVVKSLPIKTQEDYLKEHQIGDKNS